MSQHWDESHLCKARQLGSWNQFGSVNTYQDNFENRELFSPLSQNYTFVCARPYENAKTMEIR